MGPPQRWVGFTLNVKCSPEENASLRYCWVMVLGAIRLAASLIPAGDTYWYSLNAIMVAVVPVNEYVGENSGFCYQLVNGIRRE